MVCTTYVQYRSLPVQTILRKISRITHGKTKQQTESQETQICRFQNDENNTQIVMNNTENDKDNKQNEKNNTQKDKKQQQSSE